jgi:Uma2 family endonuclease
MISLCSFAQGEYWIVNPLKGVITVDALNEEGLYELKAGTVVVQSACFPGLE